MDVIPWVLREKSKLGIELECPKEPAQTMTGSPTAICVGFDPELGRRIACLLGGCGVSVLCAPSLASIAGDEGACGAGLFIIDTTTEECMIPAAAAQTALELAPSAKLVLIVPPWEDNEEPIPEGIEATTWPFDFGSSVDFLEKIKAIGREVAAAKRNY